MRDRRKNRAWGHRALRHGSQEAASGKAPRGERSERAGGPPGAHKADTRLPQPRRPAETRDSSRRPPHNLRRAARDPACLEPASARHPGPCISA